ncbi:MAG: hypothetical protein QM674_14645, partial [Burkholderiaceae bacterium]
VEKLDSTHANSFQSRNLDENGSLASISGKRVDQATPAIKGLVSVASGVIGVRQLAAAGGGMRVTGGRVGDPKRFSDILKPREPVKQPAEVIAMLRCLKMTTQVDALECVLDATASCSGKETSAIKSRDMPYRSTKADGSVEEKGSALKALYYRDQSEKTCLEAARVALRQASDALSSKLSAEIGLYALAGPSALVVTKVIAKIADCVKQADSDCALRVVVALRALPDDRRDKLLAREIGEALPQTKSEDYEILNAIVDRYELEISDIAKPDNKVIFSVNAPDDKGAGAKPLAPTNATTNGVEALAMASKLNKALFSAVNLDYAHWKARRLIGLDAELDQKLFDKLTQPTPGLDAEIDRIQHDIAITLNMEAEYLREKELLKQLKATISAPRNPRLSPADESSKIRTEIANLRGSLAMASAQAAETVKDKDPAAINMPLTTALVDQRCLTASMQKDWLLAEGVSAPDFVVTLRRPGATDIFQLDSPGKCE